MSRYDGIKDLLSKIDKGLIPTPESIVNQMIDLIPDEIWNRQDLHKVKFLDICCKSGVFPVAIKNKLLTLEHFTSQYKSTEECEEAIYNMIYCLAPTEQCAEIIRGELYDDCDYEGNVKVIAPNYKKFTEMFKLDYNVPKDKRYTVRDNLNTQLKLLTDKIENTFKDLEGNSVKFDVVVGNPPYNNDIYLDFVQLSKGLINGGQHSCVCMITPAKWQAKTDGKPKGSKSADKNEQFRKDIVPYMQKIVMYPCTEEVFDIREVSGIAQYLISKDICEEKLIKIVCPRNAKINSEFEKHDETKISLCNRNILSIIGKVGTLGEGFKQSLYVKNTDHGETSIDGTLGEGFKQSLYVKNTDHGETSIDGTLGFKRQTFVGEQDRGEKLKQLGYVEVMQGEKLVGYKAIKDLFTTINLDKYKVTTSVMAGNIYLDDNGKTLGIVPCNIIGPNQVPKGSYPVLKYFNTLDECKSFKSYYESKLVSFLFYFGACGSTLTKEFYRYIPDQVNYDHIFTDQELYEKYNLTEEEINIIESVIKERK